MDIKLDIWRHAVPVSGIAGYGGEETFVVGQNCTCITVRGSLVYIEGKGDTLVLPAAQGIGSIEPKKKDDKNANQDDEGPGSGPRGQATTEDKPKRSRARRGQAKREGQEG